jgi:thiol:disulfide interchange protein DsbD
VIDHTVLADAAVRAGLAGFNLVKVDVSANTPAQQKIMGSLKVVGPPTMIFVDPSAKEVPGTRLVGEISTDTLALDHVLLDQG